MYDQMTWLQEMEYIREDHNNMKAEYEQVGILQCRCYFVSWAACWVFINRHSYREPIQQFWHVCLVVRPHGSCSVSAEEVAKPCHVQSSRAYAVIRCKADRVLAYRKSKNRQTDSSLSRLLDGELRRTCWRWERRLHPQTAWVPVLTGQLRWRLPVWYRSVFTTSHHITSHHITSHHITSHHITSHHITSHHITSHHITYHTCCLSDASAPQASCVLVINSTTEAHIWNVCQTPRKSVLSTRWSLASSQTPDVWCYSPDCFRQ